MVKIITDADGDVMGIDFSTTAEEYEKNYGCKPISGKCPDCNELVTVENSQDMGFPDEFLYDHHEKIYCYDPTTGIVEVIYDKNNPPKE